MLNKHGIPIVESKPKKRSNKNGRKQRHRDLHKLNFNEFAVFRRYQYGIEITITVPSFSPLLHTLRKDGWNCVGIRKGEIA